LYKDSSTGLSLRLDEIDQRRLLLEDRYTKQFIAMEQVVTELSSSEDYIKNLVENWNKS
jgi:flagellar capping protein FliD